MCVCACVYMSERVQVFIVNICIVSRLRTWRYVHVFNKCYTKDIKKLVPFRSVEYQSLYSYLYFAKRNGTKIKQLWSSACVCFDCACVYLHVRMSLGTCAIVLCFLQHLHTSSVYVCVCVRVWVIASFVIDCITSIANAVILIKLVNSKLRQITTNKLVPFLFVEY